MRKVCGTCKYNKRVTDGNFKAEFRNYNAEFCCTNKYSDNYYASTFYDDTCVDWEEKE